MTKVDAAEKELLEDDIRDRECASCRFIPCNRPNIENHGVPFYCKAITSCPHNRNNKVFHSHYAYETVGELGYHFFDVHRNLFFGFASVLSVLSVALLVVGTSALSNNDLILSSTKWAILTANNNTISSSPQYLILNVGLRGILYNQCSGDGSVLSKDSCKNTIVQFSDSSCTSNSILGDVCSICSDSASSEAISAGISCISKFFALLGMQRRMYTVADSPSFKLVAIVLEFIGFVSLLMALSKFDRSCVGALYNEIVVNINNNPYVSQLSKIQIGWGSGFICFCVGAVASFTRLVLHVVTPVPHRGKGIIGPLLKIFTRCDGCCVLYQDQEEEAGRLKRLGVQ